MSLPRLLFFLSTTRSQDRKHDQEKGGGVLSYRQPTPTRTTTKRHPTFLPKKASKAESMQQLWWIMQPRLCSWQPGSRHFSIEERKKTRGLDRAFLLLFSTTSWTQGERAGERASFISHEQSEKQARKQTTFSKVTARVRQLTLPFSSESNRSWNHLLLRRCVQERPCRDHRQRPGSPYHSFLCRLYRG